MGQGKTLPGGPWIKSRKTCGIKKYMNKEHNQGTPKKYHSQRGKESRPRFLM